MICRTVTLTALAAVFTAQTVFAETGKPESKRFTADRVFDIEYAADPQISPDGKTIVYVRHSMDRLTDRDVGQLWTINVASGEHRPLVTGASAASPRWSPGSMERRNQRRRPKSNAAWRWSNLPVAFPA